MKLIIVGCGRIGSELALTVVRLGHHVTIIDPDNRAFERLGTNFSGRTVLGTYLDQDVLRRAGIEDADGLAAVCADDATNFVVARAAKEIFNVPNVVARTYDPLRREAFETLGIQVVASSSWGAQRVTQLLTHPGDLPLLDLGHGEILLVERKIEKALSGKTIDTLHADKCYPVAIIRGGKAFFPVMGFNLIEGDLVVLAVDGKAVETAATNKVKKEA
jgi:trk system potassium uptake protein TrkA